MQILFSAFGAIDMHFSFYMTCDAIYRSLALQGLILMHGQSKEKHVLRNIPQDEAPPHCYRRDRPPCLHGC